MGGWKGAPPTNLLPEATVSLCCTDGPAALGRICEHSFGTDQEKKINRRLLSCSMKGCFRPLCVQISSLQTLPAKCFKHIGKRGFLCGPEGSLRPTLPWPAPSLTSLASFSLSRAKCLFLKQTHNAGFRMLLKLIIIN